MKKKNITTKAMTMAVAMSMVAGLYPSTVFAATGSEVAKDGVYTSTKHVTRTQEDVDDENEWNEYDVQVDLKVENGKFSDIVVTPLNGYNEADNKTYFEKAYSKTKGIKTKLVGLDATEDTINNWDTVSQATRTSKAIKEAALEAIRSAGTATEVDTTALEQAIAAAKALNESDYTADSWKAMQTALTAAESAQAAKESQTAVDKAKDTLNTAVNALVKAETKEEYSYVYVGMTWAEYWANEGVLNAGSTASSDVLDSHNEYDKGAFDAVTRATTNHGLHRGSFQCNAVIETNDGQTYNLAYWKDQKTFVTTDGQEVAIGDIKSNIKDYKVTGLKYVPVKVKTADLSALKEKYAVVENGGTLRGGYGEGNLSSYEVTANVTDSTNGLKEATKKEDGSFEFSARKNDGTESGLKDVSLKTADVTPSVRKTTDEKKNTGAFGDFLRVDLDGNYGDLGANMQAVEWTYYGSDSSRTNAVATYGTKFASDNWMHKSMGIQLALTESERCQLPEGTDGTGYWKLTVYALGYEDYTYEFEVGADNLALEEKEASAEDLAALQAKVTEAEGLTESDYTADSWSNLQTELQESKDLLAKEKPLEAEVKEQTTHLTEAINNLVKAPVAEEYSYVYVGMTWAEYWANEGVLNAGSTASSDVLDSHNEYDKGAFDAVTRATTNHGLHRGSFQCSAVIETNDGQTYNLAYWKDKTIFVTTDGQEVAIGDIKSNIKDYKVTGLKYVPVKVKTADLSALKEKYAVVENGGTLRGGYGEGNLSSYEVTANVTDSTNGLKEATKKEDGSFEFSARKNDGTESGLKDVSLKTADVTPSVRKTTDEKKNTGAFGDFLRVDLDGNYGDLGANMQAVEWTYYGSDSSRTNAVATYGTKFASDNWMHKSMGIQLALTESERCQLPEGTDGTGYWKLTVYALGYEDYTYEFEVGADNLALEEKEASAEDLAALQAKVTEAEGLTESDYTADSWSNLQTELQESKDLLAKEKPLEAEVKEQTTHLTEAINNLVKVEQPVSVDTSSLEAAIAEADGLKESDYTADSWATYQAALANARSVAEAKESQEAVDQAKATLDAAKAALVKAEQPVSVDTSSLEKAISDAEALKEADYTADSWKAMQTALTKAKSVLAAKESQTAVDEATNTLNSAIKGMVKQSGQTTNKTNNTTNKTNSTTNKTGNTTKTSGTNAAKTGDATSVLGWLGLAVSSLGVGVGGVTWKRRKRK